MKKQINPLSSLSSAVWREFVVGEEFVVSNSKAYHKTSLLEVCCGGISYVTRTNLNNGVEAVVKNGDFQINPGCSIVFGAENATFFFQPNDYITGNKMYFIKKNELNKHSGLFVQMMLNSSLINCGFGYGMGLTGTRAKRRHIMLPVCFDGSPDYSFMGSYMKDLEKRKVETYLAYISKRLNVLKDFKKVEPINTKEFREFDIGEIFVIKPGKRLTKANMKKGLKPFVGSSDSNNGVTGFISNTNVSEDSNVLGVNYNGSVVENFYHPYKALFSDDVKRLSLRNGLGNEFIYLFIKTAVLKQKCKYMYGYKFNEHRMNRQKIMLPVDSKGVPDYEYMENYIKKTEYLKLKEYVERKSLSL